MKKVFLRNPKGSRDWLPDEVIKQEFVRKSLVNVFELWGYQPIQTPILINWDTLSLGSNKLSDIAFKLIGQQAEILALRADLTTPIARVAAERLQGKSLPFRFYYVGKVFRYHARKTTNERELYQIGIELIGTKEGASDLECLKIITDSLDKLGLKKYLISVNHTGLWTELFRCFGELARDLYKALSQKDLILFKSILDKSRAPSTVKAFWSELIQIRGNKEAIKQLKTLAKKIKKLKLNKIISYFEKIFLVFPENIEVDLSLTSDVDYYTGIYFEVITSYLGRNVGSGGRYDQLLSKFGFNTPAVGFSLCLEDLLLALERQGKVFPKFKLPRFISLSQQSTKKVFETIDKLHKKNKHATLKT
ncbi:MAG: ATP phosphoribosyltransferase regulatory subunit [Candidatus Melainabacteria bacterium]|nr:ATP phosphoribosyltransferase regulatory subunit [Candidatus Melainabacteria bacterium]